MSYEPRWDVDLAHGLEGEALAELALGGARLEVKSDRRAQETGNVYVELFQRRAGTERWRPSGLSVTEAHAWAFVLNTEAGLFVVVRTEALRQLARAIYRGEAPGRKARQMRGTHQTIGVLVKLETLVRVGRMPS